MKKIILVSIFCLTSLCNSAIAEKLWPVANLAQFKEVMIHHFGMDPQLMKTLTKSIQKKLKSKIAKKSISNAKNPYENNTWETYSKRLINAKRIQKGSLYIKIHQQAFAKALHVYHIPAPIITAITGIETNYGTHMGNYPAYLALGTLAFRYPIDKKNPSRRLKRQAFFQKELAELIILAKKNNLKTLSIKSSYAGALGIPQFMPSSYRHYAVNEQGKKNGDIDLLTDHNDSIMSIANYLYQHHWRPREFTAVPVIYSNNNVTLLNQLIAEKKYHRLDWYRKQGIESKTTLNGNDLARIISLNTNNKSIQYWLVSKNFNAILRYNPRVNYAMAVYQLSTKFQTVSA